jgi:Macrocin-O-methyltransferase (TylF)
MITIEALTDSLLIPERYAQIRRSIDDAEPKDGYIAEFGVFQGLSINEIAKAYPSIEIHGFDSFLGLPEEWDRGGDTYKAGYFNQDGKLPKVSDNVRLYPGWFKDTLPQWLSEHQGPIRYLNIDSDLYSSAMEILTLCNGRIETGCILYFDEIGNWEGGYPGYAQHELKALNDWCALFGREVRPHSRNARYGAAVVVVQ